MWKDFIDYFKLTPWDWFSAIVAFFSLIVAISAFVIAKRTLASQKQTEKNTMPIIDSTIQEFLLKEFVLMLLDGQIRICALWNVLYKNNYSCYPSEQILEKVKIPTNTIHPELFYNNKDHYHVINGLLNMLSEYNTNISVLNNHLSKTSIPKNLINTEFSGIVALNQKLARTWEKVMFIIYDYDMHSITSVFDSILADTKVIDNITFFKDDNEAYIDFMDDDNLKKLMLCFMETRTVSFISEYEQLLISKM